MEYFDELCSQLFGEDNVGAGEEICDLTIDNEDGGGEQTELPANNNIDNEQEIYDLTIEDEDGGGDRSELPTNNTVADEEEIYDLTIEDDDGGSEHMDLQTNNTIGEDEGIDANVDAHNLDEQDNVNGDIDNEILASGHGEYQLEGGQVNVSDGPQPGMLYATIERLFDDYQAHARRSGFSAVKRTNRKMHEEKELKYARFVCSKAGKRNSSLLSKKTECEARLNAKKLPDGSWAVGKIVSEHNHDLDPSYSILMPAHRQLTIHQKRQLEAIDIAGIRPCKNIRLLEVQSGGPENLGALRKDCQNYIEERRRKRIGDGDAEAVRNLFNRLKLRDGNFYHLMDKDNEGRLRNVLWIHPRSRAAYEDFHDAVSFDTTYLVNRHQMPFATFTGVNHHGHSILLGCALVTQENTCSFKWMFSNWLAAMGGVAPVGIITDQDESIKQALHEVMPDTIHRYCIWHIMAKLPIKFKGVADYNKVVNKWKGIVYDSLDIDTFETKWAEFIVEHQLENNRWLQDLFSEREKWVPVYLNHTFWAGMISTQRSEGMHAYFDEFLHSRCTLTQFMEQYEMAIGSKIQKEFHADFDSKNRVRVCSTEYKWEAQFQKVYTNSIFHRLQDMIERMKYCFVTPDEESHQAGIEKYRVLETRILNDFFRKDYTYTVEYRRNGQYLECSCKSFEFRGLLCCHIFETLRTLRIDNVNERYILRRWRKDVHRPCSSIFFSGGYPHMTDDYKEYQELEKHFQRCTDLCFGNKEMTSFMKTQLKAITDALEKWNNPSRGKDSQRQSSQRGQVRASQGDGIGSSQTSEQAQPNNDQTPILNPHVTKTKGRPNEKRKRSCLERGGRRGRGRMATVVTRGGGRARH